MLCSMVENELKLKKLKKQIWFYAIAIIYALISIAFSEIITAEFVNPQNTIISYVVFEICIFFSAFLMIEVVYKRLHLRARLTLKWAKSIVLIFGILIVAIILAHFLNGSKNNITVGSIVKDAVSVISPIISLPVIKSVIANDNLDLLPCVYSKYITFPDNPLIDVSKYPYIRMSIKNFSEHDVYVTFMGILLKSDFDDLKSKSKLWRSNYFITGLDSIHFIYKPQILKSVKVGSYSELFQKRININELNLDSVTDDTTLYAVYMDVYDKLHYVEFCIKKNKDLKGKKMLRIIKKNVVADSREKVNLVYDTETNVEYWQTTNNLEIRRKKNGKPFLYNGK